MSPSKMWELSHSCVFLSFFISGVLLDPCLMSRVCTLNWGHVKLGCLNTVTDKYGTLACDCPLLLSQAFLVFSFQMKAHDCHESYYVRVCRTASVSTFSSIRLLLAIASPCGWFFCCICQSALCFFVFNLVFHATLIFLRCALVSFIVQIRRRQLFINSSPSQGLQLGETIHF